MQLYFLDTPPASAASLDPIDLLMKGGMIMIPLTVLSVLALILIFERLSYFGKNSKIVDADFTAYLNNIVAGKNNEVVAQCEKNKTAWGRIFLYGASTNATQSEEIDGLLEEAANIEVARFEKNLNYLSIIAGMAPLLGFIGTIIGVITIFFDISNSEDISIAVISAGLYKKMVSSAAGLVIGIIAFVAYHLFQNSIDSFVAKIQEQALNLKVTLKLKGK